MRTSTRPATLMTHAIRYALGSVAFVEQGLLSRRTPCADWDLADLLRHTNDSLAALHQGVATGTVDLEPAEEAAGDPAAQLVTNFRSRAEQLIGAVVQAEYRQRPIEVGDRCLVDHILTAVGAVEIAVHGWDIGMACGHPRRMPDVLAAGLLEVIPLVVTGKIKDEQFARPIKTPSCASPSDHVVALLGRYPPQDSRP